MEIKFVRSAVEFLVGTIRESKSSLEVLVRMESSGGAVEVYGLLAEQLRRLRQEPNITLTVACDVAALSGGYLVASVAPPGQLLASPFASVGSIGVVRRSSLDFRDAMENFGIREVLIKSGERKEHGAGLGGMSEDEVRFAQERTDAVHRAFKAHVQHWRGEVIPDMDYVTSGDHWLGVDALKHGLVDRLVTSDEYLDEKMRENYNLFLMKDQESHRKGFLGSGEGEKSSWFWFVFDLLFPSETSDSKARVGLEGDGCALIDVLRLIREATQQV